MCPQNFFAYVFLAIFLLNFLNFSRRTRRVRTAKISLFNRKSISEIHIQKDFECTLKEMKTRIYYIKGCQELYDIRRFKNDNAKTKRNTRLVWG